MEQWMKQVLYFYIIYMYDIDVWLYFEYKPLIQYRILHRNLNENWHL